MDEAVFGDAEIQAILDIRPSTVSQVSESGEKNYDPVASKGTPNIAAPNLFEYFGLTNVKNLDSYTLSQVRDIKRALSKEFENVDDWFKFLRIAEKQFHDDDPYKRIDNILAWIELKSGELNKSVRDTNLIDPMDIYVEHAKSTGNWSDAFRLAKQREAERENPVSVDS